MTQTKIFTAEEDELYYSEGLLSRVVSNKEIKSIEPAIEIIHNDYKSSICSYGNLSVICGKAKSRKTFFVSSVMASYLSPGEKILERISSTPKETKRKVLYFDTEQEFLDTTLVVNRILTLSKISEERLTETLYAFSLSDKNTAVRIKIIEALLMRIDQVGLIVIDGIRDLMLDINSNTESTLIIEYLKKICKVYGVIVIVVLHENKGDGHARGVIGTELNNKCQTMISIEKDELNSDRSIVSPKFMRAKDFKEFAFTIDQDSLPIFDHDYKNSNKGAKQKTHIDKENINKLLSKIFTAKRESVNSSDLVDLIVEYHSTLFEIQISKSTAQSYKTYLKENNYISNVDPNSQKSNLKRT